MRYIVDEACAVVDFDDEEEDGVAPAERAVTTIGTSAPQQPFAHHHAAARPSHLALSVLRIWAHFFKGNTQWPFINMIGRSLQLYREMLIQARLRAS